MQTQQIIEGEKEQNQKKRKWCLQGNSGYLWHAIIWLQLSLELQRTDKNRGLAVSRTFSSNAQLTMTSDIKSDLVPKHCSTFSSHAQLTMTSDIKFDLVPKC